MNDCFSSKTHVRGAIMKEALRQRSGVVPSRSYAGSKLSLESAAERMEAGPGRGLSGGRGGAAGAHSAAYKKQLRQATRDLQKIQLVESASTGIQVPQAVRDQLTHEEKPAGVVAWARVNSAGVEVRETRSVPNPVEGELTHPDKQKQVFDMAKQSAKLSIFECMAGGHEKQFVAFNDLSTVNSKFRREGRGVVEFCHGQGRVRETELDPAPAEFAPDYNPNKDRLKPSLRLGAVKFDGMSSRKPNVNKTYDKTQAYYHQRRQPLLPQAAPLAVTSQSARVSMGGHSGRSGALTAASRTSARGFFGTSPQLHSTLTMEDAGFQEKLAHRRRTNVSFANYDKARGRDNSMYYISDGYNLEKPPKQTEFDRFLSIKMQENTRLYHAQKRVQALVKQQQREQRRAPHSQEGGDGRSSQNQESDGDDSEQEKKQARKRAAGRADGAYDPAEHNLSISGLRKYNKVIAKIDKITQGTARKGLATTSALMNHLSLEERILAGKFKLDDTADRLKKETAPGKRASSPQAQQAPSPLQAVGEKRPAAGTAKAERARAALLSQATTAGATTVAPGSAGGQPQSVQDGAASPGVGSAGVHSSVGTAGGKAPGAMGATAAAGF